MKYWTTLLAGLASAVFAAEKEWWKPYSPPCTERDLPAPPAAAGRGQAGNAFEFAEKPAVRKVGEDRYEIAFAVKGNCDVTVGIVDADGKVVRHLGAGVLGANAPDPFRKNTLRQAIYWDGKDDLDEYVREPWKLRVRVMLGLKPEFDKCLGGASPYNMPGYVWGLAAGPDGVYVLSSGNTFSHLSIRKFDHDARYVKTLVPPPANLPEERLGGLGFVEYEPGRRAVHAPDALMTTAREGGFLPGVIEGPVRVVKSCQPALIGNRLFYTDCGARGRDGQLGPSRLYYLYTDGGTDVPGMRGLPLVERYFHPQSRLAAAPDGKTLYLAGLSTSVLGHSPGHIVVQRAVEGGEAAKPFVGDCRTPGSDSAHFNNPRGVDCDAQGRVYIADQLNHRLQIHAPDGKHLGTVPLAGPHLVRVHQKTGAIYVQHTARVDGKTVGRLTKFSSRENPVEEYHVDGIATDHMAVDSWAPKTRLWLGGPNRDGLEQCNTAGTPGGRFPVKGQIVQSYGPCVTVWEETGAGLRPMLDFDQAACAEDGPRYLERWNGSGNQNSEGIVCDPTRETAYFRQTHLLDLRTGSRLGSVAYRTLALNDIAFDKRGYMHLHFNPALGLLGVARVDPARAVTGTDAAGGATFSYPECLYDYGVEQKGVSGGEWQGVLEVRDQGGAKGFQDGVGVNMRGDIAVQSNIYYVPKMEEMGHQYAVAPILERQAQGAYPDKSEYAYETFMNRIRNLEERGQTVFFHKRQPGLPLIGGTVWVYKRSGELDRECAAVTGDFINGCQIDEDGAVYFVTDYLRMGGGSTFLEGRGGIFGAPEDPRNRRPFTGTLIKSDGRRQCRLLSEGTPIPMDPPPARGADLANCDFPNDPAGHMIRTWAEGAAWMYAGAPIVPRPCSCPTTRFHTDWYKRTFVPEFYRHSIGVLDANGNLIMHIGRYGNWDSGNGAQSRLPLGGDNIAMFMPRFISGTDNYLVFHDWGERLAALKLNYRAEETAAIPAATPD